MKLVIEIDDFTLNECKNAELNEYTQGPIFHALKCVANGKPLDSVLDKIRAEIVTEGDRVVGEGEYFTGFHLGMICSLKIIDKYRNRTEKE